MKHCTGMFSVRFDRAKGKHVTHLLSHFSFESEKEALDKYYQIKNSLKFCGGANMGSLYPVKPENCPTCKGAKHE